MLQGLIGLDMSFRITPSQTSTPSWQKPKTCRIHPNLVLVLPPSLVTCGRWESKTKRRKKKKKQQKNICHVKCVVDGPDQWRVCTDVWDSVQNLGGHAETSSKWVEDGGVPCVIIHYGKRLPWYVPVLLSQPSLPWRQIKVCREAGPQ